MGIYTTDRNYLRTSQNPLEHSLNKLEGMSLMKGLPSKVKEGSVVVSIEEFQEEYALCRVEWKREYYDVRLDKKSLENCNLHLGDIFEWIPRRSGVVKIEDITKTAKEYIDETCKIFEDLRKQIGYTGPNNEFDENGRLRRTKGNGK